HEPPAPPPPPSFPTRRSSDLPGGESGAFLRILGEEGVRKLQEFVRVKPTFGTCAGAILLAKEITNPEQPGLGALDIRIRRNAYGDRKSTRLNSSHQIISYAVF